MNDIMEFFEGVTLTATSHTISTDKLARWHDAHEVVNEVEADKLALEEMFRADQRLSPEYEKGWNDAIAYAIEKFGRNALFALNEELLSDIEKLEAKLEIQ